MADNSYQNNIKAQVLARKMASINLISGCIMCIIGILIIIMEYSRNNIGIVVMGVITGLGAGFICSGILLLKVSSLLKNK